MTAKLMHNDWFFDAKFKQYPAVAVSFPLMALSFFLGFFVWQVERLHRSRITHERFSVTEFENIQNSNVEVPHATAKMHGKKCGEQQKPHSVLQEKHRNDKGDAENNKGRKQSAQRRRAVHKNVRYSAIGACHRNAECQLTFGESLVNNSVHKFVKHNVDNEAHN